MAYEKPTLVDTIPGDSADQPFLTAIRAMPQEVTRIGFTKAIANNVDSEWGVIIGSVGTGQSVNQTGGNLVITAGTTARAETILRGNRSYIGGIRLRSKTILSQRIANNNFYVELVDIVGDALPYTISSATAIVVTLPSGFAVSAQNVGQSMFLGGFSGTGTFLSGRYPIASVSGNDVTFTVSGFAVGTGTVSAFGWSYYQLLYTGTTATSASFDTQRRGYNSGYTASTINTTASPGHMAIITGNDLTAQFSDQGVASTTTIPMQFRANRVENVPDDVSLMVQIRCANGSTAPASNTTWTIGFVSVSNYANQDVSLNDVRPMGVTSALAVEIMRSVSMAISSITPGTGATNLGKSEDAAHASGDTGVMALAVRADVPTNNVSAATDYAALQTDSLQRLWVRSSYGDTLTQGLTIFRTLSLTNTPQAIKASGGNIYAMQFWNNNANALYIKLFNVAAGSVVMTTTAPMYQILLPGGSTTNPSMIYFTPDQFPPLFFSSAIAIAVTGARADLDNTAVSADLVSAQIHYA